MLAYQRFQVRSADVQLSFFFLVEKKNDDCEKISKCG